MSVNKIMFSAQVIKMASKPDRTWKLELNTQELPESDVATLAGLNQEQVFALLTVNPITDKEALSFEPPQDFPEVRAKTPSQRLRNVIYKIWETEPSSIEFDPYYNRYMEKLIDNAKQELE